MRFLEFGLEEIRFRSNYPTRRVQFTPTRTGMNAPASGGSMGGSSSGGSLSGAPRQEAGSGGSSSRDDDDEPEDSEDDTREAEDAFALILAELTAVGLESLAPWAWQQVKAGRFRTANGIELFKIELRQRPEYKAAFPENDLRKAAGLPFLPEAQILAYRTEARRLTRSYFGTDIPQEWISKAIGGGVSIDELEHRYRVRKAAEQYGERVKTFFGQSVGISMTDQDIQDLLDPEKDTANWEQKLETARRREQPTLLGFDSRSAEEDALYQAMGLSADETFKRFQDAGQNASRFERLAAIDQNIGADRLGDDFGTFLGGVKNQLLVDALVKQDPAALQRLQMLTAQEIGRTSGGGGAASAGLKQVGLVSEAERTGR